MSPRKTPNSSILANQEKFDEQKAVVSAISLVQRLGPFHPCYTRYTTVDRICQIIETGRMWFNRADSLVFDDSQETEKYGYYATKKRMFFTCFSFCKAENAAMWGLYCPPTYQAIRISLSNSAFIKWVEELRKERMKLKLIPCSKKSTKKNTGNASVKTAGFNDIVYASVRKSHTDEDRPNTLFWNNLFTKRIARLDADKNRVSVTGFLKDYEWSFEKEARLWIKTKKYHKTEAISVPVPDTVLEEMRFVVSPWASDDEEDFVRGKLEKALSKHFKKEIHLKRTLWRSSYLKGALKKWAQNRGLC